MESKIFILYIEKKMSKDLINMELMKSMKSMLSMINMKNTINL
jgi:hypothetical protein